MYITVLELYPYLAHAPRNVASQYFQTRKKWMILCLNPTFVQPNIRDKLTSLEARLSVQLPASRADLSPVLGLATAAAEFQSLSGLPQDISLVTRDSVSIQKDCGEDNLCVPDLRLTYSR